MIRITVEVVSALTGKTSKIAYAIITNDGSSESDKRGNYDVWLYRKAQVPWRHLRVEKFPRKSQHVWELLRRALEQTIK